MYACIRKRHMSVWINRKDRNGKSYLRQIDFDPLIMIAVIGILAAIIIPQVKFYPSLLLILPFTCIIIGLVLLSVSKISLYRKGIWFSFGSKLMTKGYASLYKLGYLFIFTGMLVVLMVLAGTRVR